MAVHAQEKIVILIIHLARNGQAFNKTQFSNSNKILCPNFNKIKHSNKKNLVNLVLIVNN